MSAAAAGPFAFSTSSSSSAVHLTSSAVLPPSRRLPIVATVNLLLLLDRCGLRDEGPQESGDAGRSEGCDEEADERYCRRQDRRRPGDVLLPLHAELMPVLLARRG